MVFNKKYTFSFTGASALIAETLVIAEEYLRLKDWQKVKDNIGKKNLMNKIKGSTFKREFSEIKKRLSLLSTEQLSLLINGSSDDAKAIVLLSLLKTYSFFRDFVVEVLRNKYLFYNNSITETDYNSFFKSKSISNIELINLSESTIKKVKQVVFKLLEQIGLITSIRKGRIIKPFLSNECLSVIVNEDAFILAGFLISDSEIKSLNKLA